MFGKTGMIRMVLANGCWKLWVVCNSDHACIQPKLGGCWRSELKSQGLWLAGSLGLGLDGR